MTAMLIFGENRLCIDNFRHYAEDAAAGNPYNTFFHLSVHSGEFAGSGTFACNIADFRRFAGEIAGLYRFCRECAELSDIEYGSRIALRMTRTGQLTVSGTVIGTAAEHTLTFTFTADQTVLPAFCAALDGLAQVPDKL
ncbi:MAG: hypothetical protein IJD06_05330 [Clostridia bacterium]|nr:hypothetical protein [Clostridia bacterium]